MGTQVAVSDASFEGCFTKVHAAARLKALPPWTAECACTATLTMPSATCVHSAPGNC